jgi:hypothetical protein
LLEDAGPAGPTRTTASESISGFPSLRRLGRHVLAAPPEAPMIGAPPEPSDLDLAAKFFTRRGLEARRFTAREMRNRKTPDFRLFRDGIHVGFCEVKSPRDERLDDAFDNALNSGAPIVWAGFCGRDPAFNRISGLIQKAVQQFDAVNAGRTLPNILVFVN